MNDHIVSSFDQEMEGLRTELSRMGALVVDQINSAVKALKGRDESQANRVRLNF